MPLRGVAWGPPLLVAVGDPTSFEVVRGQFYLYAVARKDPDVVHTHFSRDVGQNFVAVLKFDAEHCIGKGLDNGPLQYDCVFFLFWQRNFLL
jgi:hypothetical protein